MSGARRAGRAVAPLAAIGLTLGGGCVRVDAGPSGVSSLRIVDNPPSIVVGDVLRDSAGLETALRVEALDEAGRPVPTATPRFTYVATLRDTLQRVLPDSALAVDSLTGRVRARAVFVVPQGVVAARVGDRLQLLDTLAIVPRPTSAALDSVFPLPLRFDCVDTSRTLAQRPTSPLAGGVDTLYAFNAVGPFRLVVRGDSAGATVPVRRRLVRWRIDSGPAVPAVRLPGGGPADTVAAIGLVSTDGDRLTALDTTDASGQSAVRVRIRPFGLGRRVVPDTFTVRLRAIAQPGPVPLTSGAELYVRVRLARRPGATGGTCE